jgi:hypothetical protein
MVRTSKFRKELYQLESPLLQILLLSWNLNLLRPHLSETQIPAAILLPQCDLVNG